MRDLEIVVVPGELYHELCSRSAANDRLPPSCAEDLDVLLPVDPERSVAEVIQARRDVDSRIRCGIRDRGPQLGDLVSGRRWWWRRRGGRWWRRRWIAGENRHPANRSGRHEPVSSNALSLRELRWQSRRLHQVNANLPILRI